MSFKILALIACAAFWFGNVCLAQSKNITVSIEPYKMVTHQAFFRTLSISAEPYAENIKGFDFEWGYSYQLEIKAIQLKNPPMDGSSVSYDLVKVISKEKVEKSYRFPLYLVKFIQLDDVAQSEDELAMQQLNDSTYRYFNVVDFVVPESLRPKFSATYIQGLPQNATFEFVNDSLIRMISIE